MRIFVLGAGATGSLLAQLLERQGHTVWCGDRDPERARRFLGKKSTIAVTEVNARNLRGIVKAAKAASSSSTLRRRCLMRLFSARGAAAARALRRSQLPPEAPSLQGRAIPLRKKIRREKPRGADQCRSGAWSDQLAREARGGFAGRSRSRATSGCTKAARATIPSPNGRRRFRSTRPLTPANLSKWKVSTGAKRFSEIEKFRFADPSARRAWCLRRKMKLQRCPISSPCGTWT